MFVKFLRIVAAIITGLMALFTLVLGNSGVFSTPDDPKVGAIIYGVSIAVLFFLTLTLWPSKKKV